MKHAGARLSGCLAMMLRPCAGLIVLAVALGLPRATAAADASAFDAANKLYEQARYTEAAAAYQSLIRSNPPSVALHFNLGNAWFKAGQTGRALAAWHRAGRQAPRDPGLRFNVQFARRKVTGGFDPPIEPGWQRALGQLTVNEWTLLTAAAVWACFLLLALGEARSGWRRPLGGYATLSAVLAVFFAGCLAGALHTQEGITRAVVVTSDAVVRQGALEESQSLFQLKDGMEVTVLDRKTIRVLDQPQEWLEIRDSRRRVGWLKNDQVIVLD